MILLQYHLHELVWRRCGRGPGGPDPGGEQQRRLLQQWGLQSAPASQARPPGSVAPKGAVVGEALVLSARELRLVLTLLLVMFMTGEA
jgi:hypothetical protein